MTHEISPELATERAMAGDFDHWAAYTLRGSWGWECGADQVCTETERGFTSEDRAAFGYRLHLTHSHLGTIIATVADTP